MELFTTRHTKQLQFEDSKKIKDLELDLYILDLRYSGTSPNGRVYFGGWGGGGEGGQGVLLPPLGIRLPPLGIGFFRPFNMRLPPLGFVFAPPPLEFGV